MKTSVNLRGRKWINPEGLSKYFNAIQGWKVELKNDNNEKSNPISQQKAVAFIDDELNNDLPF